MNILGFNPHHHSSVCVLKEGEIVFFLQEERISRTKYCELPFKTFIKVLKNNPINSVVTATPSIHNPLNNISDFPIWKVIIDNYTQYSDIKYFDLSSDSHHLSHAASSFYNSGFTEAISLVIDGLGSGVKNLGQETETIYACSYPSNFIPLYKNIFDHLNIVTKEQKCDLLKHYNYNISSHVNLSRAYEAITMHLGWDRNSAGKTMGLSSYGKENPDIPNLFLNHTANPNIIYDDQSRDSQYPDIQKNQFTFINEKTNPKLKLKNHPKLWHHNKNKITNLEKDLAWRIQNDTQQIVGDYIEKAITHTNLKNVCCSGGYFLNCVTNYYLKKRFPNINFYFDPVSNDAGIAIGSAKLLHHQQTGDLTIRPLKSLYLGYNYPKNKIINKIKKYVDK